MNPLDFTSLSALDFLVFLAVINYLVLWLL